MSIRSIAAIAFFQFASLASSADLALTHARIYASPDSPPIDNGTVVVHDGSIAAVGPANSVKVPPDATVLDCKGAAVTAGFWNSHVHILTPQLLHADGRSSAELSSELERMLTRWGFTTVFDIASVLENTNGIRRRIEAGQVRGPRILTVGEPFYPKGGTPIYVKGFFEENHIPSAEVDSVEQAVNRVRQQIRDHADGVKIFAGAITASGVLPMPLDIAKALVAEAHRGGRPAFAHPSDSAGLDVAIESGVDVLAHTAPGAGPWTDALVQRMRVANMALIPTLTLFHVEAMKDNSSPEDTAGLMKLVVQQLRIYAGAGGQILFGTDVGYIDQVDTSEEFGLMSQAGMDFKQILAALTTNPARRFKFQRRNGRLAPGLDADIAVLDGDPASDPRAFSRVRYTIRAGKLIYQQR